MSRLSLGLEPLTNIFVPKTNKLSMKCRETILASSVVRRIGMLCTCHANIMLHVSNVVKIYPIVPFVGSKYRNRSEFTKTDDDYNNKCNYSFHHESENLCLTLVYCILILFH